LLQFIDARDLGEWIINCCENKRTGVFNAVGPQKPLTMESFLNTCCRVACDVSGATANFIWLDEQFLIEHNTHFWSELPLCIRPDSGKTISMRFNSAKALSADLQFRALEETIEDTLHWAKQRPADYQLKAGLSRDKEQHLLHAWLQESANQGVENK